MSLANVIGQQDSKNMLRVPLLAYRSGKQIGNILLTGPAGNGKTHMAESIASELGIPQFRFDVSAYGKKDLTRILSQAKQECKGSQFLLILDEIQAINHNPSLAGAILDLLDVDKRTYPVVKNGFASQFPGLIVIGCTNEPWKIPNAIDSRFSLYRMRLSTPTDLEIAEIMRPQLNHDIDPKMLESLAVAAGNHARKANGIANHVNLLCELGESFTVESILCDLSLQWDGASIAHIQILDFLAGHQKGEFMGWANQDETARFCRMHKSELKYYIEFLERRGYVVINERSQLEITDDGRNRIGES